MGWVPHGTHPILCSRGRDLIMRVSGIAPVGEEIDVAGDRTIAPGLGSKELVRAMSAVLDYIAAPPDTLPPVGSQRTLAKKSRVRRCWG